MFNLEFWSKSKQKQTEKLYYWLLFGKLHYSKTKCPKYKEPMQVQWPKGSNLHSTFVSALLQPRYHDFPTYLEAKSLILVFCSGFSVFWHVCASLCLSCVNSRLLYVLECGLGWCKCGLHKPIITFPSDSCHMPARPVSHCCSVNCIPAHIATYITDRPPRWHGPWEIITLLISIGYTGFMCN